MSHPAETIQPHHTREGLPGPLFRQYGLTAYCILQTGLYFRLHIKGWEFFDQLSDCRLLNKGCTRKLQTRVCVELFLPQWSCKAPLALTSIQLNNLIDMVACFTVGNLIQCVSKQQNTVRKLHRPLRTRVAALRSVNAVLPTYLPCPCSRNCRKS